MSPANPNWFAYLALFGWPLVTVGLYIRLPMVKATIWSILGGYLLLPVNTSVDLPMIPPMNKDVIPNLSAFLVCRFMLGKRIPLLPERGMERWLVFGLVISKVITALLNGDAYYVGPRQLPAMTFYDAISDTVRQWLYILPFLMARQFLNTGYGCEQLLKALVVAGLWYSLPMLLEIRLSPQLHQWIYGFFPHMFAQQMRAGGFRPVVFLGHGLWVAFFCMTSLVAAAVFWRLRQRVWQFSAGSVTLYLSVILILCKSLASAVYGVVLVTTVWLFKPKVQIKLARIITVIVLIYPVLRGTELLPLDSISELAKSVSTERAQSFQVRIYDEQRYLKHAGERPLFGWGGWDRNGVFDLKTGYGFSGADGRWIITYGKYGWIGYITEFLLLSLPIFRVARAFGQINTRRDQAILSGLCLILAITLFDCIPNDPIRPLTWLLVGAISGHISSTLTGNRQRSKKQNT